MSGWLNKPLTMNRTANALIYGGVIYLINTCLAFLFNAGFVTMMSVAFFVTIISVLENCWVGEIERRQSK